MNKYPLKKLLTVPLAVLAAGYCSLASSHDLSSGPLITLNDAFWSTDVHLVQCSTDSGGPTDYLEFSLFDITQTAGGGKLSVVVEDQNGFVTQTSDPVRDDGNPSPVHQIHAGDGSYRVMIHKLKEGTKVYKFVYHCKSSTGAHTGTSLINLQNQ